MGVLYSVSLGRTVVYLGQRITLLHEQDYPVHRVLHLWAPYCDRVFLGVWSVVRCHL